jgi:hypothetical protein
MCGLFLSQGHPLPVPHILQHGQSRRPGSLKKDQPRRWCLSVSKLNRNLVNPQPSAIMRTL